MTKDNDGTSRNRGSTSVVSRCLKGKRRDAMDEIKAWISDSNTEFGRGSSSRVSAQPPKNITEQKMLESKLFEMSKQRYNFILHSKWQQKLFMEKQRQKTAVMKDLLKNVNIAKIRSTAVRGRDIHLQNAIARRDQSTQVARSEIERVTDGTRTISPTTTAMTVPEGYQKKTVTFVTERANMQSLIEKQDESKPYNVTSENPSSTAATTHLMHKENKPYVLPVQGRWPVFDERFVKLREALSENYHGRRSRGLSSRNVAVA